MKTKYYSLKNIMDFHAVYNIIIGERSNGKTYAVEEHSLKEYCESGVQLAIIRRWADDFTGKRGQQMFDAIVNNGLVSKYSNDKWDRIVYKASRWYLAKYDEELDKIITEPEPFAFGFALNTMEHDKSISFPKVGNILFDEFLTRRVYLPDEFVLFMNTLSTIIRDRGDVKIFMCGNTVNKYSPYFTEMGLTNIEKMKQGTIDLYTYGNSDLTVAVEYCSPNKSGKKSNKYFAFDNPKLNMITNGAWEIALYPHLPIKYTTKDIKYTYYVEFNNHILTCEVIKVKQKGRTHLFTYVHKKTTPLQDKKRDIIFSPEHSSLPNHMRKLAKPINDVSKYLYSFYVKEKVFYQDNEVGEIMRNYINWCKSDSIL